MLDGNGGGGALVTSEQAEEFRAEDKRAAVGQMYTLATGGVERGTLVRPILAAAGLNFEVETTPMFMDDGTGKMVPVCQFHDKRDRPMGGKPSRKDGRRYVAVRNMNTKDVFNVATEGWKPIQFVEGAALLEPIVQAGLGEFAGAMALRRGALGVLRVKLDHAIKIPGYRHDVQTFLNVAIPHDGTLSFHAYASTIMPVCENTLAAGIAEAKANNVALRIKHTASAQQRLKEAETVLRRTGEQMERFQLWGEHMAKAQVSDKGFALLTEKLLPLKEDDEGKVIQSPHIEGMRARMRALWGGEAAGIEGVRGTGWAAAMVVSEFADHFLAVAGKDDKEKALRRVDSANFGRSAQLKRQGVALIEEVIGELV